jgi:putative flavoprotein involved in K+ transport
MKSNTPSSATADWLASFAASLTRGDAAATAALFTEDGYWRDLVSFTWNIVTLEGRAAIAEMLIARLAEVRPESFRAGDREGWFTFETAQGRGKGHVRLKDGKAWTFFTALMELKGFEEKKGPSREHGTQHGAFRDRVTWTDRRKADAQELGYDRQPYVLVIGGGQGGIALGARLRRLGVPAIIVEKNDRPGDSWRKRYKSLCLHDPVWYDHLPYLNFPDDWPVFAPKDKIGDWLEMYTRVMELNYWSSTTATSAKYDEVKKEWEVHVTRDGKDVVLRPKQLVLATGMSAKANWPKFPGQDIF